MKPHYTEEEDAYICENYCKVSAEDIGEHIGRSPEGVRKRALHLGFRRRHNWSQEEDALLCEYYGTTTLAAIGDMIGRSAQAVWNRAKLLGVWRPVYPERQKPQKPTVYKSDRSFQSKWLWPV